MAEDSNNRNGKPKTERRQKVRRANKDRRGQVRWELDSPLRRKGPGRRVIDVLLKKP